MAKKPDPVDIHVGKSIRIFRMAKRLSQTDVGKALGITFQQVQKYEKGSNRVGSSRLAKLAQILDVPINRFFEDGGKAVQGASGGIVIDLLSKPYALRMLKALADVPENKTRLALVELTESIAKGKR
jgi:transcriptional regulator with XRE-family HTH domain